MTLAKKILITTHSSEIIILRAGSTGSITGFCPACGYDTPLLTLDQAVSLTNLGTRRIFELSEMGRIHSVETESKHLLVCAASIGELALNLTEKNEK